MNGQTPPLLEKEKQQKSPKSAIFRKHAVVDSGKQGEPKWRMRSFLNFLDKMIILPLFRVRVTGLENLPDQRPVLLSPNHLSNVDGLIIFALSKKLNLSLRILGKRELWNIKPLGWVLDHAGILPISREKADLDTLRTASAVLKAGDSMAIFPEGTRIRTLDPVSGSEVSKEAALASLGEASGGAAWLAIRNNVAVIPVGISGTERIRPDGMKLMRFPAVNVHFGTPLVPDQVVPKEEFKRKERIAKLTELIMSGLGSAVSQAKKDNKER